MPLDRTGRRPISVPAPADYRKPGYPAEEHREELRGGEHPDWRNATGTSTAAPPRPTPPPVHPVPPRPTPIRPYPGPLGRELRGNVLTRLLRTTDAKQI